MCLIKIEMKRIFAQESKNVNIKLLTVPNVLAQILPQHSYNEEIHRRLKTSKNI